MQLLLQVIEWIVWMLALLVGVGFALSNVADPGVRALMRQSSALLLIGVGITLVFHVNKFHLIWVAPIAFMLPGWWMKIRLKSAVSRAINGHSSSSDDRNQSSDDLSETEEELESIQDEISKIGLELKSAMTTSQRQRLRERLELLTGLLDTREAKRQEEIANLEQMLELEEQIQQAKAERDRLKQEVSDTIDGLGRSADSSESK